jgi:hypothetical protein
MGGADVARRPGGRRLDVLGEDLRPRVLRAGELAWIAVVPCGMLVVAAIVLLGPPLGQLLFPGGDVTFWPVIQRAYIPPEPESTEHARYLLSLVAPLLLAGFVLYGAHRADRLSPVTIRYVVIGSQIAAFAFLVTGLVVQRFHAFPISLSQSRHVVYFTNATLVVGGAIAVAIGAGIVNERIRERVGELLRERRGWRIAGTVVAVALVAIWMLPAINFERTIVTAHDAITEHIQYWLDEAFAVLDGHFPLVDYAAQYASLWPYPVAGAMALLSPSVGVFTIAVSAIGVLAMLAVFGTFRRITRSTTAGLLLFLPFLATSLFMMRGPLDNRYAVMNLFGTFPLRYAGPFLLVWLVARHLDRALPRRSWLVFLAAGVVVLNNVEFGAPALGATIAALLWSRGRELRAAPLRPLLEAVAGLVGAVVLTSALTLVTAGSLPHFELLVRLSRLFALSGFGMLPMSPTIGMSTVVYLTYVAAIGVATVRAANDDPDRLTTGLLAWSGVFGLGVGGYYMGRSYPEVLTNMFPAWALSVTLLFVVAVRSMLARSARRPTLAEAVCLFGFGVMVCSLAQTPTPWSQVARLQRTSEPLYAKPLGQPFIAAHTRPGESVALFTLLGHRAAYNLGLDDVTPYAGDGAMPTVDQFDEMLADLRAAGGRKVFISTRGQWPEAAAALDDRGYRVTAQEDFGMVEYVRRR